MTQEQYIIESARTCKETSLLEHQIHMILGITGEFFSEFINVVNENDRKKIKDEGGDVLWYLAGLARSQGLTSFTQSNMAFNKDIFIVTTIGELVETVKKKFAYGKEINNEEFNYKIFQIYTNLLMIFDKHDIDIEEVFDLNIQKLNARFPDKFEADLAINKNYNIEQQVFRPKE